MASKGEYDPLVTTATPVATPVGVEIVAPETLSEGYNFDAEYNGTTFPVTVPAGGVVKGQRFTVPFGGADSAATAAAGGGQPPQGRWKDGLCSCFKFGLLHPSLLNAWLCPQILMAQVLTRMKLNWLGNPAPENEWRGTFRRIVYILIAYVVVTGALGPFTTRDFEVMKDGTLVPVGPPPPRGLVALDNLVSIAFGLYTLIVLTKLRWSVRERYHIPEHTCVGCEDICCSAFCGCCTVAQLARHTADYEERRAVCCSETGLPLAVPAVTV